MKRLLIISVILALVFSGCTPAVQNVEEGIQINFSDDSITVDGQKITTDNTQAVYSANDIVFYLADRGFTYGEGEKEDEHEQSEADAHTVVHITEPGRYVLSGKLSLGQIAIDLGEDAKTDPEAVVTLVLNNLDITCTVAPAIIFYNVYECGESDTETAVKDVDTSKAGANVIIADGSENNVNGSYVARIYKSYELSEDGTKVVDNKKLHKYDAAFYSKRTMNVNGGTKGNGILNINAENEGLDSELHLTINGGIINIVSGNDGINTNEDYVSVTTINGGVVNIRCDGSTGEGDGIDSNGWLVINGGKVIAQACDKSADSGIDSDMGIYINGGEVIATGNMLDRIAEGNVNYAVFNFASRRNGNNTYTLKKSDGNIFGEYAFENGFSNLIIASEALEEGDYTFWQGETQLAGSKTDGMRGGTPGGEFEFPEGGDFPWGENFPKSEGFVPEMPEDMKRPENFDGKPFGQERPEMPEMNEEGFEDKEGFERPEMDKEGFERPEGMPFPSGRGDGMGPGRGGEFGGNRGGMGAGNLFAGGESSVTFTIEQGGNQFSGVAPVKE